MGCFMEKLIPHSFCLGVMHHFSSLDVMSPQDKNFFVLIHEVSLGNANVVMLFAVSATKIIGPVFRQ
jgi:hypothetical protein